MTAPIALLECAEEKMFNLVPERSLRRRARYLPCMFTDPRLHGWD
jgi:hypothetical protein